MQRALAAFVLAPLGLACQDISPRAADIVLGNVTVVDMENGTSRPGQDVYIEGGRIIAIEPHSSLRMPAGAAVVDATGQFAIPGLWDMHVHSATSTSWHFPVLLAHGVTGVRNMHSTVGDALGLTDSIRAAVASGRILGPRFVANGPIIDGEPSPWPGAVVVRSEAQARAAVDSLVAGGAEFIKVYDNLSLGLFLAVMDQAVGHGIPVDGHVPFAVSASQAASAGIRTIEHLSGITMGCSAAASAVRTGFAELMAGPPLAFPQSEIAYLSLIRQASDAHDERLCEQTVRAYVEGGVTVSPTLAMSWSQNNAAQVVSDSTAMSYVPASLGKQWSRMAGPGPGRQMASIMAPVYDASLNRLRLLNAAGVPLVAGTDLGNPFVVPGRSLHDELATYVTLGMSPIEALRTATVNPAHVLGMSDSLGAVAEGYVADVVLLGADPTDDINNVRLVEGLVRAGRYYARSELVDLIAAGMVAAGSSDVR